MRIRDSIKWLWKVSGSIRPNVLMSSLAGILHVAASMSFVWVSKKLIDSVTVESDSDITFLAVAFVTCMALQILISAFETRIQNVTDIRFKNRLRHKFFRKIMESRWQGKETYHSGDVLNRITEDVRVISEAMTRSVPAMITAVVQFVAAFIFLFILEPVLAFTVPVIMLLMLVVSRRYIARMQRLNGQIREKEGDVHALIQESFQRRVVIHTLERTPYISDSLEDHQKDLMDHVKDKTGYAIFARTVMQIGFSAGYAAAFIWGVTGIKSGAITFGMMTAFLQLVNQIQRPVVNMSRQVSPLIRSFTSVERLADLAQLPSEVSDTPVPLKGNVGLKFENVSFGYPEDGNLVFKDFSYDFRPGSVTAIIGETGAGKSTLMRMILALLQPDSGNVVLYDDYCSVPASPSTRCNFMYVPQGNSLMSGTIRENLLLGDPEADEAAMKDALHIAVADFVLDLPDGLDTVCGEYGAGLSEGQAHRIAIARALLHKGAVILLDEPTSALDSQTEKIFLERLSAALKGRTVIIVTHSEAVHSICDDVVTVES